MKLTRSVWMGFKNIGDAAHNPEIFNGTLAAGLEWLILKCSEHTIAKRFTFNIARSEAECLAGLEGRVSSKSESADRLRSLLNSLAADDDDDDSQTAERSGGVALSSDPQDDYVE